MNGINVCFFERPQELLKIHMSRVFWFFRLLTIKPVMKSSPPYIEKIEWCSLSATADEQGEVTILIGGPIPLTN